ncbi:MAG: hypothetical protein ACHQHP_00690 [Bacteroidia bacterium]
MNTFKKIFLLLLLPSFTAFTAPGPIKKDQARHVIRKTATIILVAHKRVKEGKVYTGDLARAIAHQKYAIKLYRAGEYFRAIHHSRRARFLAIEAIKANKGAEMAEWKMTKEEEQSMANGPKEEELDKELIKEMPNESAKDEEVIGAQPQVDLNDNE